MPRLSSFSNHIVLLGAFAFALFAMSTTQRVESYGSDSSVYIHTATNLFSKWSYEFNFTHQATYPPGFPLILALLGFIGNTTSYSYLICFMPLFSSLGLVAWYFVLKKELGNMVAVPAILLVGTSSILYSMSTRSVLSDVFYFALSGCTLLTLCNLHPRITLRFWLQAFGATLLVVWIVLTRSAGIAMCGALYAWVVFDCIRRRSVRLDLRQYVALIAATAGMLTFVSWSSWSSSHSADDAKTHHMSSYSNAFMMKDPYRPDLGRASLVDLAERIPRNAVTHAAHLGSIYLRGVGISATWFSPIVILVLLSITVGAALSIYRNNNVILSWYLIAYVSIYLIWPFDEGQRFMLPVAPLAFALAYCGVRAILSWAFRHPRTAGRIAWTCSVAILAGALGAGIPPGLQAKVWTSFWLAIAVAGCIWTVAPQFKGVAVGMASQWVGMQQHAQKLGTVMVVLLAAVGLSGQAFMARDNLSPQPSRYRHAASVAAAEWLLTAPPGTVMAGQDAIIHRLSGRRLVPFPITLNGELIATTIRESSVRFLVVCEPLPYEYFEPDEVLRLQQLEMAYPMLLQEVYHGPGYRVFQVASTGAAAP